MYSPMRWKIKPTKHEITLAKSIFVPGHKLDEFLDTYKESLNAKVLVVGNSDRDYFYLDFEVPRSVNLILLQNSHISHDLVRTLPIGIENIRYGKNGFKRYFKFKEKPRDNRVLIGPFSKTHKEREELNLSELRENPNVYLVDKHISPRKLSTIASNFTYVACPRGNGTDTHRFWETLYRGSIPVVKKSDWSASLINLGIPYIEVNNWSTDEILTKVESYTGRRIFNPSNVPSLWLPYWKDLIVLYSN
jgi:hypothetical protein